MFGYINVNGKELSPEDKKVYQSYYCGLCKRLHSDCGVRGQMLLNYDMTFLVVLLTGLYEPESVDEKFFCALHPLKRRSLLVNEVSDYAAAMNVLLAYYNLLDDWEDDKNFAGKILAGALEKDFKRICSQYPRQAKAVEAYIRKLSEYEKANESNIDLVAGLTGDVLGEIFAWKQDEWYDELKTLGCYLGKFIYLMDAYEDINSDERKNRYNPLCMLRKEQTDDFEVLVKLMMTSLMTEAAKSFERLPILLHADILRNILYSGVWTRYEYLQLKKRKRSKE